MPDVLEPSYQVADTTSHEIPESESRTKEGLTTGDKPANAEKTTDTEHVEAEEPEHDEVEAEEESAPSEEDHRGEEASTDEPPIKKSKGVQKRIDELTRQRYEAERERENAKQEAEYWRKQASQGNPQQQQKPNTDANAPRFEDFESYEAFVEAKAEYAASKKFDELTSKQRDEEARKNRADKERQFAEKVQEAKKRYDDFEQVALGKHVPYSALSAELVLNSEQSIDVAYYLGKNPDVADRIAKLPPIEAAREIGRIEAKLSVKPSPKKITGAPPPIKPVGGKEKVNKSPQEMSNAEYRQWRMQQSKRK